MGNQHIYIGYHLNSGYNFILFYLILKAKSESKHSKSIFKNGRKYVFANSLIKNTCIIISITSFIFI